MTEVKFTERPFQWIENRMLDAPYKIPHYAKRLRESLMVGGLALGWTVMTMVEQPVQLTKELYERGYKKNAVAAGLIGFGGPVYVIVDELSSGKTIESALFGGAISYLALSMFAASPFRISLRSRG